MSRSAVARKLRYRVAVVGCGKIGALFESELKREKPASHAGAVTANEKTELVALVDTDPKSVAAAGKMFPHAACYVSLADCLKKERLDIVVIATPPTGRVSLIGACVKANIKMIVCEKPLAASVREAQAIESLLANSRTKLILNYHRRFSPLFTRARSRIAQGQIGMIQQVTCYYSNGLYNNGGHTLDALQYLLDDDFRSVIAVTNTGNKTFPKGDIHVDALIMTKKGTTVVLQSFDQREYGIHDFHIYGTKGSIVITDYGVTLVETPVGRSRFAGVRRLDDSRRRLTHVPLSATKGALSHAIECYEKRSAPSSSTTNGVAVLHLLDAMAKSAKRGGKRTAV